jgi:O-antigen ligase
MLSISSCAKKILSWWWAAYVIIYPLLMPSLGTPSRVEIVGIHIYFTLVWVIIGILLLLADNPDVSVKNVLVVQWNFFRVHPTPFLAFGYGIWALFASLFAKDPIVALTGTISEGDEGAFWTFLLCLVFYSTYYQVYKNPESGHLITQAIILNGLILACISIFEVITQKSIFYTIQSSSLPVATFPQSGHLSGYLTCTAVGSIFLWLKDRKKYWLYASVALIASLGYIQNRAALVTLIVVAMFIFSWKFSDIRSKLVIVFTLSAIYVLSNFVSTKNEFNSTLKNFNNTNTFYTRLIFWRAASNMTLNRPIFGWGAGGYYDYWMEFLDLESLKRLIKLEQGVDYVSNSGSFFFARDLKGNLISFNIFVWRSHNQFFEITLIRGLIGLLIYMALLFFILKNKKSFLFVWVFAYHVFLGFWYLPIEAVGVLWVAMAAAAADYGKVKPTL